MISENIENSRIIGLGELSSIMIRRRWWLILPVVAGTLIALIVAIVSQPMYRSSTTLLIESPEIPTTLVASPITDYADERIAKIRQQVLNRSNLVSIIRSQDLYREEQQTMPPDSVLMKMRDAVTVELVSASAGNAAQHGANTTIAFTLSFTYPNARVAHDVTQRLTEMFIQEDKRLRTEQASGTATFMGRRADEIRDRLAALEGKRRGVEARYSGALPEQVTASAQTSATLRAELSRIDSETQGLVQQNGLIAARGAEIASTRNSPADAAVDRAEDNLARVTALYSDTHPDVIAARAALDRARNAAAAAPRRSGSSAIDSEIAMSRARIADLSARRGQLVSEIAQTERVVAMAPQANYELNNIERDYDNLKQQYQDIREKQLEAQVAANLQQEDKGERFSMVDPPSLPFEPVNPNRVQIVLIGLLFGIASGAGLVLVWELAVNPVHGPNAVARLTGEPPLATVPAIRVGSLNDILTWYDRAILWWKQRSQPEGGWR